MLPEMGHPTSQDQGIENDTARFHDLTYPVSPTDATDGQDQKKYSDDLPITTKLTNSTSSTKAGTFIAAKRVSTDATSTRLEEPLANNNSKTKKWHHRLHVDRQKRDIVILCLITVLPMIAFTATILLLVFRYNFYTDRCTHPELCFNANYGSSNDTNMADYYFVDYPAARLVFVASWSSTVRYC
jgi:hypothetical protein